MNVQKKEDLNTVDTNHTNPILRKERRDLDVQEMKMARPENNGQGKVTTMPAGSELKSALPKHKKTGRNCINAAQTHQKENRAMVFKLK